MDLLCIMMALCDWQPASIDKQLVLDRNIRCMVLGKGGKVKGY